jgi:hypothetical protein
VAPHPPSPTRGKITQCNHGQTEPSRSKTENN